MIYILTGDGRALPSSDGTYTYEYHMKDHLGNTRVAYTEDGNITQTADYYPFGMQHESNSLLTDGDQKYLNNGKELQDETGWYDFGARMYDASLGRWLCTDPLAEEAYRWSPYRYSFNNPIRFIDLDGMLESTHIDEQGNVISVYDDGNIGIYQHTQSEIGSGKLENDLDKQIGFTMYEKSFSQGDKIDLGAFRARDWLNGFEGNPRYVNCHSTNWSCEKRLLCYQCGKQCTF